MPGFVTVLLALVRRVVDGDSTTWITIGTCDQISMNKRKNK